ncbi:MAG: hypothetical protein JWP88_1159 [Flaviaesturariibacter sp.]|nr:hypothetical protein [Flaviaesturariibacter sp.]
MKKTLLILMVMILIGFNSCKQNSEEAMPICSTSNVTYSATIQNLITTYNCKSCHNNRFMPGGVNAESYTSLKDQALNGRLYGAITHTSPYIGMPLGYPKMSDCDISKIKAWIDAGAPNN